MLRSAEVATTCTHLLTNTAVFRYPEAFKGKGTIPKTRDREVPIRH